MCGTFSLLICISLCIAYRESLDTILQEEGNKHVLFQIYINTQEDKKESTSNQMMKHSSK
jgi:hypothetical protein